MKLKNIVLAILLMMFSVGVMANESCGVGKEWNEFSETCVQSCQFGYKWNNYTQSCIEDDMEEQEDGCEEDE